ncbi:MAG: hypothetical protein KG028_01775 [Actinobacteria bacterium]|nr:hypothetical protein [Actinomycetota bacterium]
MRDALRTLAQATRTIDEPQDAAVALGALTSGLVLVRQVLNHVADWHEQAAHLAARHAVGSRYAGRDTVDAIVSDLRDTADALLDAQSAVGMAWGRSERIAWRPEPKRRSAQPATSRELPSVAACAVAPKRNVDQLTR